MVPFFSLEYYYLHIFANVVHSELFIDYLLCTRHCSKCWRFGYKLNIHKCNKMDFTYLYTHTKIHILFVKLYFLDN